MRLSGGSIFGSVGSEKAMFVNDDLGGTFHVQFNPKEMSLDESASWKESEEFSIDKPLVEFERGKAATLSMELIFDTTDTGEDVRDKWTKKLAGFVSVTQGNTGGTSEDEDNKHPNMRPPRCTFKWGNFTFPAVVETVKTSFIMFGSDGNPLRAKVSIKLKERNEDLQITGSGPGVTLSAPASAFGGRANSRTEAARISVGTNDNGPSNAATQEKIKVGTNATRQTSDLSGVSTYTVQEGDTLSGIALELSIEFWWLAAANNVEDPMNLTPGDTLIVPPSEQVAEIFQHLPAEDNWYWGDYDPELNQDSDLADIFAIYDGTWDPFAEQELEDLGAETALEVGVGDQVSGEWAMSDYQGQAPDPTKFEHGESDSADTFATSGGIAAGGSAVAMAAGPGLSDYSGQAPDASTFEHGESDSADTFATSGGIAAGGSGGKPVDAAPGVSDYSGERPEATTFEHGESGSSDIFSIYASPDEEEEEAPADTAMSRDNAPAPAGGGDEAAEEPAAEEAAADEPAAEEAASDQPADASRTATKSAGSVDNLANANRRNAARESDE